MADPATPAGSGLSAVLWDLDGTLVDSEPYWIEAEFQLVEAHGGTWSMEHALALVGSDLRASAEYIRRHGNVRLGVPEIIDHLVDAVRRRVLSDTPWRPGAWPLLEGLRSRGTPCALVTMSHAPVAEAVIDQVPAGTFAAVVTGDMVVRGKPDAEPYRRAAQLLGLAPEHCLAIEDSETGARSAVAAGAPVLVVPAHVTVAAGEGRHLRDTLVGITPGDLDALWVATPLVRQPDTVRE